LFHHMRARCFQVYVNTNL